MLNLIAPGKRKGNRFYLVRGRVQGQLVEASTKTTDRRAAQRFKVNLEQRLLDTQKVITAENMTFSDAVARYKDARELSKNEERYVDALDDEMGDLYVNAIVPTNITKAANKLYPKCKPQTKNRQAIRPALAILHHAHEDGMAPYIVCKGFKEDDPERPIIPVELGRIIVEQADGDLKVLILTLVYQGWRITETLSTKLENVDFDKLRVRRFVAKSRKWVWTALDPDVAEAWKAMPERDDGYIFPWRTRGAVYDHIEPLAKKCGVKITPHMFRRGFATTLLEHGADLKSIAKAGNWQSINSVAIYADANLDHARDTLKKLKSVGVKSGEKAAKG